MDEHNELRTRLRAVGMELFRRDGLRFTMQQAAAMMHISKKTIYAVYPSNLPEKSTAKNANSP